MTSGPAVGESNIFQSRTTQGWTQFAKDEFVINFDDEMFSCKHKCFHFVDVGPTLEKKSGSRICPLALTVTLWLQWNMSSCMLWASGMSSPDMTGTIISQSTGRTLKQVSIFFLKNLVTYKADVTVYI